MTQVLTNQKTADLATLSTLFERLTDDTTMYEAIAGFANYHIEADVIEQLETNMLKTVKAHIAKQRCNLLRARAYLIDIGIAVDNAFTAEPNREGNKNSVRHKLVAAKLEQPEIVYAEAVEAIAKPYTEEKLAKKKREELRKAYDTLLKMESDPEALQVLSVLKAKIVD